MIDNEKQLSDEMLKEVIGGEGKWPWEMSYDVRLERSCETGKTRVIKYVKELLNIGLKESRDMVNSCPVIISHGITYDEANKIVSDLNVMGAKATAVALYE